MTAHRFAPSAGRFSHVTAATSFLVAAIERNGKDQGQRPAGKEEGGAAETAGRSEGGAFPAPRCQGYRRSSIQTLQDLRCPQVHRQSPHSYQPDTEGESEEVLQGEEVQAFGPEAQEDSCHPSSADKTRAEPDDQEDAEEVPPLLHPQIRRQGLRGCTVVYH